MIPNFQIHKNELPDNLKNNTIYILLLGDEKFKIFVTDISGVLHSQPIGSEIEIPNIPNYTINQKDDIVEFSKDNEVYFTLNLKKYVNQDLSEYASKKYVDNAIENVTIPSVPTYPIESNIVETLSDIKAIKNPSQNQKACNLAHNEKGLSNLWGGGEWIFDKEPFFEVAEDVNLGRHGRAKMVKTTPFKDDVKIDSMCGQSFMTADGKTFVQFRSTNDRISGKGLEERYDLIEKEHNGSRYLAISKGSTIANCWMANVREKDARSGDDCEDYADGKTILKAGTKFYPLDDDFEYAKPTYTNFDGHGFWKRIFKGRPTLLDAGCIPASSSHAKDYVDNTNRTQVLLDNWNHNGFVPKGVFLHDGILKWRRTKSIKSEGIYFLGDELQSTTGLGAHRTELNTCGVLATNKNQSLIHKQGGTMYDSNLNLDGSASKMNNKDLFYIDMNYSSNYQFSSHITCVGNSHYRNLTENGGTNGVHISADDLEQRGGDKEFNDQYKKTNGTMFFSEKNTLALYNLNYGLRASKPNVSHNEKPTNINGIEFEIIDQRDVKWLIDIERDTGNSRFFRRTGQSAKNVRKNQVGKPWNKIPGRCEFDSYPMDWKINNPNKQYYYNDLPCSKSEFVKAVPNEWKTNIDEAKGTYSFTDEEGNIYKYIEFYIPNYFIEFTGTNVNVGQLAGLEINRRRHIFKNPAFGQALYNDGIINSDLVIPNRNRSQLQGMFIEALSNPLLYADLDKSCQNFYIKAFKKDGTEQSKITVSKPESVLRHENGATKVTFGVGSDKNNDYVEFYIDGNSGRLRNSKWMYITLSGSNFPNKVTTNLDEGEPYDSKDYYGTRTLFMPLSTDATDKYIVRFYGLADPKSEQNDDTEIVESVKDVGSYIIQSISIQNTFGQHMPVVNKGEYLELLERIEKLEKRL